MSVIAAQGPRGHVALMALEDVLRTATERGKSENERKREEWEVEAGCQDGSGFFPH